MINPPFPIAIVLKDSTSSFKLTTKNFPNREGSTADTKAPQAGNHVGGVERRRRSSRTVMPLS